MNKYTTNEKLGVSKIFLNTFIQQATVKACFE